MADVSNPQERSEGAEVVRELISVGLIKVDAHDKRGLTPLHIAVQSEKYLLARTLLQNGADVNIKSLNDYGGQTALGMAILAYFPDMVKILLEHQAGLTDVCAPYESALWSVITNEPVQKDRVKHKAVLNLILEHGLQSKNNTEVDYYKLCKTIVNDDFRGAKHVINFLEDISFDDMSSESPLDFAVHLKRLKIVELLIKKGPSKFDCETAFFRAIDEQQLEMVKLFLKSKFNVNSLKSSWSEDCEETPLYRAVEINNLELLKLLLDHGAEVEGFSNYDLDCRETALHAASRLGFVEAVKLLLERGAQADLKNSDGQTPLHLTCPDMENLELLKLLLKHGAQITTVDNYNWSVLQYIGNNLEFDVVKYVINLALENGMDINTRSKNGLTAIDCVMCENLVEFLKIGADLNVHSDDGEYPQHDCYDRENECPAFEYIGRLQYLGYKVDHPEFQNNQTSVELLELYRQELERLNQQIIAWNPRTTLRDVLFMSRSNLIRYSRNDNLREAFAQCGNDFETKFIYFGSVLNSQCRRGIYRNKLITSAKSKLQRIIDIAVPDICGDMILKYLENCQLMKFVNRKID